MELLDVLIDYQIPESKGRKIKQLLRIAKVSQTTNVHEWLQALNTTVVRKSTSCSKKSIHLVVSHIKIRKWKSSSNNLGAHIPSNRTIGLNELTIPVAESLLLENTAVHPLAFWFLPLSRLTWFSLTMLMEGRHDWVT